MLQGLTLPTLEQDSGLKIVMRALEEPLRRIVSNAADEPSIVLDRVDGASQRSFDCMIANAPKKEVAGAPGMGEQPEIY